MKIITSGSSFLDIDGYGGIIAYAELLNLQGESAKAISTAPLNASVSPLVREWQVPLGQHYQPDSTDAFTLIDISEPKYFDRFVDLERVEEVIDHHLGFEQVWQEKIGDKSHIEFVGAACTLVYERWANSGLLAEISQTSARLLMCGILDNTLNFGADITTQRDRDAYAALAIRADLPQDWPARYFADCQQFILQDTARAMDEDAKTITYPSLDKDVKAWQLAVWDADEVFTNHFDDIKQEMGSHDYSYLNLISLNDMTSYFICANPNLQQWLEKLLGVAFTGDRAKASRMWLRKEIMKEAIEGGNHETH